MDKEKHVHEKKKPRLKPTQKRKFFPVGLRNTTLQKCVLLIAVSFALSLLLTPSFTADNPKYELGDVADRNIKAKRDFLIEDEKATAQKREEAARQSPLVYDWDEKIAKETHARVDAAFDEMKQMLAENQIEEISQETPGVESSPILHSALAPTSRNLQIYKKKFSKLLGVEVPDETFSLLLEKGFDSDSQKAIVRFLDSAYERGIVANQALLLEGHEKELIIRKLPSNETLILPPPHSYPDLEEARNLIRMQALELAGNSDQAKAYALLASQLLRPNLLFNLTATERYQQKAVKSVKPVYIKVKKNEMLVREGQRIGPEELLRLNAQYQGKTTQHPLVVFLSIFLFSAISILVVAQVSKRHLPTYKIEMEDFLFLGILLVLLMTLGRFSLWVSDMISESSSLLSGNTLLYAIPFTAGAMMASIFFGVTVSLIFSLIATIFAGMLFGMDFWLFFYFLLGSFVAAHGVTPCRNRIIPIKAGLLVGCANVVLIVLNALLLEEWLFLKILINSFFGFCGGAFAGILVTGLTPLAEIVFGYTTDIKLLELATMDQPLMQELMVHAPGTYQHSIIVGNMAEGAAKAIGANSLLAKVSGYYHDIGKIKKPLYFIENQFDCQNRHQKLAPSMSSLILISHIKEGVELAKEHKLGRSIIDIICQHHGTSLISFFYNKAIEAREKAQSSKRTELPPIDIDDYRYPGPKPQTKEAGLVMLADVVEAACRSLSDPTPARIKGTVNRLVNNVFSDGQLEECELTLKDLHQIAKHFNQVMATVHHKRIEYPQTVISNGKVKMDAYDPSQREAKQDRDRPGSNKESGRRDLKRLGLH